MISTNFKLEIRNRNLDLVKIFNKVKSCNWVWLYSGGCGRCQIQIACDIDNFIKYFSPDFDVRIFLYENNEDVIYYRGYIDGIKPLESPGEKSVALTINGYFSKLKRTRINDTISNLEISEAIKYILDNYIVPLGDISYDEEDIDLTSFVLDTLTFDTDAGSALSTLVDLAGGYEWGIDREAKFFFKKSSSVITKTLKYRKDFTNFNEYDDYGSIINQIVIKGGSGFEDTINNTESQNLYGIRTQIISNSAITTSAVSQQYGTKELSEKARISRRLTVKVTKDKGLIENSLPIGRVALIKEPVSTEKKYNFGGKYGDGTIYGGMPSYKFEEIKYILGDGGISYDINLGQPRSDVALEFNKLRYEIENVRNS